METTLKPGHPGEILREEFMAPWGFPAMRWRALGVTPARINEIVRERRGISADTALRLARFFGTDAHWLNFQSNYDIECAQRAAGVTIAHIQPFEAAHA